MPPRFLTKPAAALFGAMLLTGCQSAPLDAGELTLSNDQVVATWTLRNHTLWPASLRDLRTGRTLALHGELFSLVMTNGDGVRASDLKLVGPVRTEALAVNPNASCFAERRPGQQLVAELTGAGGNLHVTWRGILRDGSRYLRQQIRLKAGKQGIPLKTIVLLDTPLPDAHTDGTVSGSPVVTGAAFLGVEHPLSNNRAQMGRVICSLPRGAPLRAGESYTCSSVIGFYTRGQLRRDFLAYLERERAHPYRPFLHYNSWYDLGAGKKYDQAGALNRINAFGQELVVKRGVKISSFLFDDGWDNNATLWQFNSGFPDGFAPIRAAAAKYGAAPGLWLSPWGGYGKAHDERIKYGREHGYEIRDGNFSLGGPKYYNRFRSICFNVVTNYGVNQFKFDGIGVGNNDNPGAWRDFDAMLRLIGQLRVLEPDIYINQTTGTWPSPFWLIYVDSTWRGGADHSFAGPGSWCQRWITYRDEQTYRNVVERAPLYPLNSLMLHGIIYARYTDHLKQMSDQDFRDQVRAFFGDGTQLQEMYITPDLLDRQNWDDLAAAANWSRANAGVLVDTHWVGGDPGKGQVYGWAAWSPQKGILTLRNPAPHAQSIEIDAAKAFELPEGAPRHYRLISPFKDQHLDLTELEADRTATFNLEPFEVLIVEAIPVR